MFTEIHWGMAPILDAIRIFFALLLLAPVYVFLDALRPWRHEVEKHFDVPKEGMVCYIVMSAILLIVGLLAWAPSALARVGIFGLPTMPGLISGLALFLKVVLLFAYLKRVTFNKVMRRYAKEMRRQNMLTKQGRPVPHDIDIDVDDANADEAEDDSDEAATDEADAEIDDDADAAESEDDTEEASSEKDKK